MLSTEQLKTINIIPDKHYIIKDDIDIVLFKNLNKKISYMTYDTKNQIFAQVLHNIKSNSYMYVFQAIIQHYNYFDENFINKVIYSNKIDINLTNHIGRSALMMTSCTSNINAVRMLLNHHDINVNLQDKSGLTALMLASDINIVRMLLNHPNIDVNLKRS